ncbi:MAG: TetR/AcrR family transcriptional repressor of nem operon [Oleispira sp.]|jgi:TetR/AcrR family transcriptional repressor of nem operon
MARPQIFNQQWVISKAIECFWIKGYSDTSLADLLKAMNISRSTFYNSFGDKKKLFELCLQTYSQQTRQILTMTLLNEGRGGSTPMALSAFEVIKQFLHIVLVAPNRELSTRGCLLVNTIAEAAKADEELSRLSVALMQPVKLGFIHQLKREFTEEVSHQYGEWLFTQLLGWRLQCQMGLDNKTLEQQINWSLLQLKKEAELPVTSSSIL